MEQAIAWLIALLIIGLAIWAIARENERRRRRTPEEYEREVGDARSSMMRAGMLELDKVFGDRSGKKAAVEYLKDEEQGQTKVGSKGDDADRTEREETR